jgi:hypothetical protein
VLGQTTCNTDSLDWPRPELGGSHHLRPHSILYVYPQDLHSNDFLSQDSQGGVPKLSRFGLLGFWELITPSSDLRLGWNLKKTCSSSQDSVSHSTCTHRNRVNFWLLVVKSQIASLILDPSFNHNLCCRSPNGSCKIILDIYALGNFQRYKEHFNARCFGPCNQALNSQEFRKTSSSHFWECEFHPHTCFKVGLRHSYILNELTLT